MVKNILLLVVLIPALVLASSGPILLGEKDDAKITLTYLEREKGDELKVKFDVVTGEKIEYQKAYVAFCCYTPKGTNAQQEGATQEEATQEETNQEGTAQEGQGTQENGEALDGGDNTTTETTTTTETNGSSDSIPGTDGGSGNGRNLKAADGQCFAVNFNCIVKTGCTNALDIAINLFASQVNSLDEMVWQDSSFDLSTANIGAAGATQSGEYHTRYRFNKEDAIKSNIPLLNEEAHLTCYTAYNVSYTEYELDKVHNLKDTAKFSVVTNAIVAVTGKDLTEDNAATESSFATYSFVQISVLGLILAVLNTF